MSLDSVFVIFSVAVIVVAFFLNFKDASIEFVLPF